MALESALVDLARRKITVAAGAGQTEVSTQWFQCRLISASKEGADDRREDYGRNLAKYDVKLLTGLTDLDGVPLELKTSDVIEVESEDLGQSEWEVRGAPRPLRRITGIIGYSCVLNHKQQREVGFT